MENLERDLDTHKVDHPEKNPDGTIGSKDVADAVAASAYMCLIDPRVNTESAVLDGSNTISDGVGINTSHNPIKWGNLDEEFKMISGRRNG
jgi:hypothetical protein